MRGEIVIEYRRAPARSASLRLVQGNTLLFWRFARCIKSAWGHSQIEPREMSQRTFSDCYRAAETLMMCCFYPRLKTTPRHL